MEHQPKRRRKALPLVAAIAGAIAAALTIFAGVLPAAADANGGGSFTYSFSPTTFGAQPGSSATVTLAIGSTNVTGAQTSLNGCWQLSGAGAVVSNFPNLSGTFQVASGATTASFNVPIAGGAALGSSATVTLQNPCADGSGTDLALLATGGNISATITVGGSTTPTVTSVSPTSGATGSSVTISGSGLTGSTSVAFGTTAAAFTVVNDSTITATVPGSLALGTYSITVTNPAGNSTLANAFTVTSVTSAFTISPSSGPVGTAVTITGTGFTGATAAYVGGAPLISLLVVNDTTITGNIPASLAPGTYGVSVATTSGTQAVSNAFTVTLGQFTISPASGPVGTAFTLTGSGFLSATGGTIGGVAIANFAVVNDTTISGVVPAGLTPGTYTVTVSTPSGIQTLTNGFTVTGAPVVTGVTPTSGGPGTSVTITGSGFTGATGVTFGGVAAASFTVNGDTSITAVAPTNLPTGTMDIIVTTPSGSSATSAADQFTNTASAPTVTITLQGQFTLIGWVGQNNISVADALRGGPNGAQNGTNDITSAVSVVWSWNSATQTWQGYFPSASNVPGANDLTTLQTGMGYFIGLNNPSVPVQWTIQVATGAS